MRYVCNCRDVTSIYSLNSRKLTGRFSLPKRPGNEASEDHAQSIESAMAAKLSNANVLLHYSLTYVLPPLHSLFHQLPGMRFPLVTLRTTLLVREMVLCNVINV